MLARVFPAPLEKVGVGREKGGKVGGGKRERNRESIKSCHFSRVYCGPGALLYYL